jgi:hypothetical protein
MPAAVKEAFDRVIEKKAQETLTFLASMPSGYTAVPTAVLQKMLLDTDGVQLSQGRLCDIKSKRIGPGVYRVWLAARA